MKKILINHALGVINIILLFTCAASFSEDRYVVEPGTIANGNGGVYTDWSIAATQIQWAVDVATNASDTVWVSNGVYLLTNQIVVTNAITLRSTNGPDGTIVNGGFVFGAENATSNNRCLYMSNISAFVSGFTFSNGACTNIGGAGVWMGRGVLSNCTVCNSTLFQPTNAGGLYFGGGGVATYGASTVTTCRIINNTITNPTTTINTVGTGGGLYCRDGGYFVVNCLISNNVTYGGIGPSWYPSAAGAKLGSGTIQSSLICNNSNQFGAGGGANLDIATMIGCTVALNWASSDGGGCYILRGIMTNCVVSNNSGRGISMFPNVANAYPTIKNTTIIGNTLEGIFMYAAHAGTCIVSDCIIADNTLNGVTFYQVGTNKHLLNSIIRNNKAGGVSCQNGTIRNCLIAGNTNSGSWGGLLIAAGAGGYGTASVSSCTIVSNQSAGPGAGLRFEVASTSFLISSCVIYSNGVAGTNDVFDACAPTNYSALQYSCLGTNPGFTGAVVIVADPAFRNFAGGNYRLSGSSLCVNTGSNEPWMTNTYDLDKNQRIRYGIVDMGVYERINEGTVYSVH